jgi:16S rRNA (cytosine1402-N4)-methyltransferase
MLDECIDALNIKPNGLYVDCTLGGAGHSFEIAKRLTDGGKLIGIDRDEEALAAAGERLSPFSDRVELVHSNFCDVDAVLNGRKADGVLIDLGVSSHQLDSAERGFSYINDAPLDMRMNRADPISAFDIVNSYSREQLIKIFYDYGEEKFAPKVADAIISARGKKNIETTLELAELVRSSVPRPKDGGHPAKRVFQAIRIEVNNELGIIEPTILKLADLLN